MISRKDIDELIVRHILHSLAIAKLIQFKPNTSILDVGTGGGFPGIPLAIMFPECQFHLVDAIAKKIKVVQAIASDLGLSNVTAEQARAEQITTTYDFIVSRAVTDFPTFYRWVGKNIAPHSKNTLPNGILCLKGGDLTEEIKGFQKHIRLYNIHDFFTEEFFETKKILYFSKDTLS
ncbi:ribosomal RNA small subunit methyltransferase G [Bacteroidia bacterium]|nr:ribosomal RNA small subunit methyltransferase G [Bacteroidia bacterium]